MHLSDQAGWNQTEDDGERFLDLSASGAFVAEWDGIAAGTVITFVFGATAWIAMMLVEKSLRGRGIGTTLMRHALAFLDKPGIERVRLDATRLGRPIYEKLGFVAEYEVFRYEGVVPLWSPDFDTEPRLRQAGQGRLARVIRFDTAVTGTDRAGLLRKLYRKRSQFRLIERGGKVKGYVSFRPGARARHIGPCLAAESAGERLLRWAFWWTQGVNVMVDVPEPNRKALAVVETFGLSVRRTLMRMCRGPRAAERTEMIWASSGPEKG